MGEKQGIVIDIVKLEELLIRLEGYFEYGGDFGEAVEAIKVMRVELEPLDYHLLSEHPQHKMLKPSAYNHIFDGSRNELL